MANGWGGKRRGAGQKKGGREWTSMVRERLREHVLAKSDGDADRAFALIISFMDDETQSTRFRADCAREVLDRVWGRPTQHVEQGTPEQYAKVLDELRAAGNHDDSKPDDSNSE